MDFFYFAHPILCMRKLLTGIRNVHYMYLCLIIYYYLLLLLLLLLPLLFIIIILIVIIIIIIIIITIITIITYIFFYLFEQNAGFAVGANGVPVFALVKFVKRAFSFEQWETFDALVEPALELLSEYGDVTSLTDKKSLELMLALEPFYSSSRKVKKTFSTVTEDGEEGKGDKKGESTTHVQGDKTEYSTK